MAHHHHHHHRSTAEPTVAARPQQIDALRTLIRLGSLHTPMVVRTAATLRLVDHILAGARTVKALAARTDTRPEALLRLIRHLVAIGLLEEDAPGEFVPTEVGELLADDHPAAQRAWHDLTQAVARADISFTRLPDAIRTGRPTYESIYGKPFYEDLAGRPDLRASFDSLLACDQDVAFDAPAAAYDWTNVRHVLDVGGGKGGFAAAIARRAPHVSATVLEMAGTVDTARSYLKDEGLSDRVDVVEGDFFEPLPRKADAIILSFVLLNWPDHDAVRILTRCAEALEPGGRILIHERAEAPSGGTRTSDLYFSVLDLRMLVFLGGALRTREKWDGLAASAGLVVEEVRQLPSPTIPYDLSLLVLAPAATGA
uniref:Carminomycin 4-O-methyltransferase DnrK,Methyltransferase domain-containing protein n=1 Tax=Streptomyces peucetius TaxID=1950 RepID=UPI002176F118|nr:Chain A, Carminomycin 4-O-methyltransferase DnrK,Methyltransferase domain-containing protein [synthetic construct]7PHD_B Chain B, Carminomycin 4-O-methyltransferase DnrK,Methyltransferase domain-containing protein [synthetic construct]